MVCPAAGVVGARGLACKVTGAGAMEAMVTGRLPALKKKILYFYDLNEVIIAWFLFINIIGPIMNLTRSG